MPIDMPRGLPFAVDTWGPSSRRRRHRFLTHAHRDHLIGAGADSDGGGAVYATRLTLSLALRHFPQLGSWEFLEMEVGRTVVVDDPTGAFSVTAYDANHCPGAVMFLFEGQFGTILHTGDCRLTPDCVQNLPIKHIAKKGKENICRLDFVFLDCTFAKCFLNLPSKESAIRQVVLCAVIRYVLSVPCWSLIQMVGFHQLYVRASKELAEAKANLQPEPLFIRPSTQWYASSARSQKPSLTEAEQDEFGIWHVCFSIHSSRDELEQALQLLQPQWVISTTPPCFAIELTYVKKHCFKTRLTADDPLWKIFRDPLEKSVSSPCSVLTSKTHADEDHSSFVVDDDNSSSTSDECTYLNVSNLELKLLPPPPPEEPGITLFGRARFASQAIDIVNEEYAAFEEARVFELTDLVHGGSGEDVEIYSTMDSIMKQGPASQQNHMESGDEVACCQREATSMQLEAFQGQTLPTVQRNMLAVPDQLEKSKVVMESKSLTPTEGSSLSMVRSAERTDCQKEPLCTIGSSTCLNASLKRFYRSRNIPVPRPLPSLVSPKIF
ncbi:hypothetical protein U9M48_016950 [Paspalum notatum var. saurae]|uniref:DNA repair metallo-beta-lactamase domain-containing protein n=1 Tax=Paspalum notatum var. saurae TaxID=547442 RepID=A0AAQ3T757_PASNO